MDTWNAKYRNKWNEFEVKFCSDDYEKAKAVERVCQYIMDGEITSRSDVAPVRRGHWIKCGYACGEAEFKCSLCGEIEWRTNETDYCPNCGADMREVPNDD